MPVIIVLLSEPYCASPENDMGADRGAQAIRSELLEAHVDARKKFAARSRLSAAEAQAFANAKVKVQIQTVTRRGQRVDRVVVSGDLEELQQMSAEAQGWALTDKLLKLDAVRTRESVATVRSALSKYGGVTQFKP